MPKKIFGGSERGREGGRLGGVRVEVSGGPSCHYQAWAGRSHGQAVRAGVFTWAMRTPADRLRHTILFEVIGLVTCTPLASWALGRDFFRVGVMTMIISLTAMVCNYLFNLAFDHVLESLGHPVNVRPPWLRAVHAVLFEASLMLLTVPFVAWWLDLSLWAGFLTEVGFAVFFLVYAYIYNWAYDAYFPMPVASTVKTTGD